MGWVYSKYHTATTGATMFIIYIRNGVREKSAAWTRNLAFLWVLSGEGEDIEVVGYEVAA